MSPHLKKTITTLFTAELETSYSGDLQEKKNLIPESSLDQWHVSSDKSKRFWIYLFVRYSRLVAATHMSGGGGDK